MLPPRQRTRHLILPTPHQHPRLTIHPLQVYQLGVEPGFQRGLIGAALIREVFPHSSRFKYRHNPVQRTAGSPGEKVDVTNTLDHEYDRRSMRRSEGPDIVAKIPDPFRSSGPAAQRPHVMRPLRSRMRKRSIVTFAVFALVIVAAVIAFRLKTRPIPFDSNAWRSGDAKVRFRMKDSLVAKHAAGALPTREVVDRVLGPDDDRADAPEYRRFRLMEWYGNPWYLRVRFDEQDNVVQLSAHPD
jgi:hypothetical protein